LRVWSAPSKKDGALFLLSAFGVERQCVLEHALSDALAAHVSAKDQKAPRAERCG
jgi:hypothetical protein